MMRPWANTPCDLIRNYPGVDTRPSFTSTKPNYLIWLEFLCTAFYACAPDGAFSVTSTSITPADASVTCLHVDAA
jgi:hypothetical protein